MERQLSSKNVATFKGGVTAVVLSEEKLCNHLAARLAGGVSGEALCSVILEAHVLHTGGLLDGMPLRSRETLRAVRLEGDVLLFGEFPVGAPFRSPETMSAVRLEGHFFFATTLPALRVCMLEGRVLLAVRLAGEVPGEALRAVMLEGRVLLTDGLHDGVSLRSRETLRAVRLEGDVLFLGRFPVGAPFRSRETFLAVRLEGCFSLATRLPAFRVCMLEGRVLLAIGLAGEVRGEALRAVMLEGRVLPARRLSGGAPPSEDTTPVPPFLMSLTRFPNRPPALGLFAKGVAPTLGLSAKGVVVLQPPCDADCREQSG